MSAQICADCTAAYSIGAPKCPECGANNPRADHEAPAGPSATFYCPGQDCPAYGARRVVPVRTPVPGVVEHPALHCAACDRVLAKATDEEQETQDMPKVTRHGGPSIDGASETEVELANGDLVTTAGGDRTDEEERGEGTSPDGGTSSTSSERESTSPETSENAPSKPARTTGSRSKRGRTANSSATGTDGGPTEATSASEKDGSGTSDSA